MSDKKILLTCVITARASYPRVQTLLEALAKKPVELQVLCVGSSNDPKFGNVVDQILKDGWVVVDAFHTHDSSMAMAAAKTAAAVQAYISAHSPTAILTVADRHETLGTAIAASYSNTPLIHVQGGELSSSIDGKVRHAITMLADLHLTSTRSAAARIRHMLQAVSYKVSNRVAIDIGGPDIDLALRVKELPPLQELRDINTTQPFLLVSFHPDTTEPDASAAQERELAVALANNDLPVLWFTPNPDAGHEELERIARHWRLSSTHKRVITQVSPTEFLQLMNQCSVFLGNSSALIREGSALGTPAILIGRRQLGREAGPNVVHMQHSVSSEGIERAIEYCLTTPRPQPSTLYGDGKAGERGAEVICKWLGL